MMKEAVETVEGFIYSVSPRRQSKNNSPFFTVVIQNAREEYHRVVVFAAEKQATFMQAEKNGNAVKLRNMRRSISFSDPEGYDVMCSRSTSVEATQLPFLACPPPSSKSMKIAEVQALGPKQKVGEVRGKVRVHGAISKVVTVKGSDCELKEVRICDGTGEVKVTLWDSFVNAAEGGKSYAFKNVSTRQRDGSIHLCTGPSSIIEEIADLEVAEGEDNEGEQAMALFSATIKGIELTNHQKCPSCQVKQKKFVERSKLHRCEGCRLKQSSLSFFPSFGGKAIVTSHKGEDRVLLTNSALSSYLRGAGLSALLNDTEAIEDHFLDAPGFDIKVSMDGFLLSIQPSSTQPEAGPSVAAEADSFSEELRESDESILALNFAGVDSS